MLNLLIMSLHQAKAIEALWLGNPLVLSNLIFSLLALFFVVAGILGIWSLCMHNSSMVILAVILLLLGVGSGLQSYKNTKALASNRGAADNVIDYHRMAHLRKIYPKLPCRKQIKHKTCNSNSLAKVSKDTRLAKHMMTRHQAVKKYNEIKAEYRSTSEAGNRSSSLQPRAPRWYNYI